MRTRPRRALGYGCRPAGWTWGPRPCTPRASWHKPLQHLDRPLLGSRSGRHQSRGPTHSLGRQSHVPGMHSWGRADPGLRVEAPGRSRESPWSHSRPSEPSSSCDHSPAVHAGSRSAQMPREDLGPMVFAGPACAGHTPLCMFPCRDLGIPVSAQSPAQPRRDTGLSHPQCPRGGVGGAGEGVGSLPGGTWRRDIRWGPGLQEP